MSDEQQNHTGRRRLLIVHGRGFKPAEQELLDISVEAMRHGLKRDYPGCAELFDAVDKSLFYYGDASNELLLDNGKRYDEKLDIGDRRNALKTLAAIPERKRFDIRRYDRRKDADNDDDHHDFDQRKAALTCHSKPVSDNRVHSGHSVSGG